MKSGISTIAVALSLAAILTCGSRLMAEPIDYSSLSGTSIKFNGTGGFSLTSSGGDNIKITDGSASGLLGDITGNFTIGSVTTAGIVSSANVSGVGSLVIYDGSTDLTATITWGDIVQIGPADTLNDTSSINLSNISYSGSNADLLALASAQGGIDVQTFQFIPIKSLTTLESTVVATSFSGTIVSVPDSGTTALLIGLGIGGIAIGLMRRGRRAIPLVSRENITR